MKIRLIHLELLHMHREGTEAWLLLGGQWTVGTGLPSKSLESEFLFKIPETIPYDQ